jgi:predicted nucleic acid-binding Zn ribbon protein
MYAALPKAHSEFGNGSSYCSSCGYGLAARRSNQDMDQAIHIRNMWFRNRAKRLHIPYDLTDEQLTELYVIQKGRCAYCDKPMVMKLGAGRKGCSASIERIIPQKRGGTYTLKNVVWVHFGCNARRCAQTGERLKICFPEASKAIEHVAQARQLELPFPTDSHIDVTNDPEPQPAGENQRRIKAIPSFISAHTGVCSLCGLPGDLGGLMSIPGVPGHYCSVGCVEYRLFGPGKCRWCGFRLDSSQSSFCSDQCRFQNEAARFGSGMRFARWLSRHEPRLFADLVGKEIPTGIVCLECGDNLEGKRHDSRFCSSKCRKRFSRSRNNPATTKRGDYPGDEASVCVIAGGAGGRDVQSFGCEF